MPVFNGIYYVPELAFYIQNTSLDAVWYNGELLWEYKGGTWQPRWLDAAAIVASPKWIVEWQGGDANKPLYIIICDCIELKSEGISHCVTESKTGGSGWCGVAVGFGKKNKTCFAIRCK